MRGRGVLVAAAALVVVIAISGTLAALAASDNLPWQTHVANIASDQTAGATATAAASTTPPPGSPAPPSASATSPPPAAVSANVKFTLAFPNLPKMMRMTNLLQVPGQQ
ncbi:MAG: hypothetical protein ACRDG3_04340, partial [Tepidiformaceae bacterium]